MTVPTTSDSFVATLDVGSSSVRALLYDAAGRQMEGHGAQLAYQVRTTPDGGAEVDAEHLAGLCLDCLDEVHRQSHEHALPVVAVGASAFWHGLMGVGENGAPTTPVLHLLDTRSRDQVSRVPDAHSRTGCVPHSSYWPAKLLWLERNRRDEFRATRRWIGFPEYLFGKLFGRGGASTSMVSGTGLWDQNSNDYDPATLAALPVGHDQLTPPANLDEAQCELRPQLRGEWPGFAKAVWFPAVGDGACDNIGSGCATPDRFSLMVGTTGAMRALVQAPQMEIDPGSWCYRADRGRFITGGALSNGGDVFAWAKRALALPKDIEARLDRAVPGSHRLAVLPFFSGERTPYWRSDLRAAIAGLSLSTEPFDILQAALEGVTLSFREIFEIMVDRLGSPVEIVASGGGLLRSPAWTQMMADALGHPVTACTEQEASSRGAALLALERLGHIEGIGALSASAGATFEPRAEYAQAWSDLLAARRSLFAKLYGAKS